MGESIIHREIFEDELPRIAALFKRHDYGPKKIDWLRWKYFCNPDGAGRMYVAENPEGTIVGFQGFIPRRFTSPRTGTFLTMHNLDVFVAAEFRGQGIYSRMSKYSMSTLIAPRISFPNDQSIGFSVRDGFTNVEPFKEWLFPVAIGAATSRKGHGVPGLMLNSLSRIYAFMWLGGIPDRLKLMPVSKFERDFEIAGDLIHGVRSADYLNWRFIDNPMQKFTAFEFFEGDQCLGYCVYALSDSSARIFDLVTFQRQRACLCLLLDHCRAQEFSHLSFLGIGLHLGNMGFIPRRSADHFTVFDVPAGPWMVTLCDRDV